MANPNLSPLNDLVFTLLIEDVNTGTGVITPVTTGTVTGFLATDNAPTATTADPSLSISGVYIGGANGFAAGTWLFNFDATILTAALLNTLFNSATPYLIISRSGAARRYVTLTYTPSLAATAS